MTWLLVGLVTAQTLVPSSAMSARLVAPQDQTGATAEGPGPGVFLSKRPVAVTLSGLTILALGVAAGLGGNASDLARQANESNSDFYFRLFGAEANKSALGANVALGLAAATLVGAIIAFIVEG